MKSTDALHSVTENREQPVNRQLGAETHRLDFQSSGREVPRPEEITQSLPPSRPSEDFAQLPPSVQPLSGLLRAHDQLDSGGEMLDAKSGHHTGLIIGLIAAAVVVILAVSCVLWGIPGTAWHGVLNRADTPGSMRGIGNQAVVPQKASFVNGYKKEWTVTFDDLGFSQSDFGGSASLSVIAKTDKVWVLAETGDDGLESLVGVNAVTGEKLWSGATEFGCNSAVIAGTFYCEGYTDRDITGYSVSTGERVVSSPDIANDGTDGAYPYFESEVLGEYVLSSVQNDVGSSPTDVGSWLITVYDSALKPLWSATIQGNDWGPGPQYDYRMMGDAIQGDVLIINPMFSGLGVPTVFDIKTGKVLYEMQSEDTGDLAFCGENTIVAASSGQSDGVRKVRSVTTESGSNYGIISSTWSDTVAFSFNDVLPSPFVLGDPSGEFSGVAGTDVQWTRAQSEMGSLEGYMGVFLGHLAVITSDHGVYGAFDLDSGKAEWQSSAIPSMSQGAVPRLSTLSDGTLLVGSYDGDYKARATIVDSSTGNMAYSIESCDDGFDLDMDPVKYGLGECNSDAHSLTKLLPAVTPQRVGSMPSQSQALSQQTVDSQVEYLQSILAQSSGARASLDSAAQACDVAELQSIAQNRQDLLDALQSISVDKIPDGERLIGELRTALSDSLFVDNAYLSWAQAGCRTVMPNPPQNAQATVDKKVFVDDWNTNIVGNFPSAVTIDPAEL